MGFLSWTVRRVYLCHCTHLWLANAVYPLVSYRIVSCCVVSYHNVSCRVVLCRTASYRIVWHRIASYRIPSSWGTIRVIFSPKTRECGVRASLQLVPTTRT